MAERLDWPGMLGAGLGPVARGGLGLDPVRFWALSPVELALMLGIAPGRGPLGRGRLEELMRAWPDRTKAGGDGNGGC
ncbi:phage tail assembly chaperone [Frigidibacter sp. MR17.14]|uniref:phage tail assembly chaperone n=1 Tax=Frigidibacter sp. MR17.14 TaxID=3126509 RepID=UPI0030131311